MAFPYMEGSVLLFMLGMGLLALLVLVSRMMFVVVEVYGPSMVPTFAPHDRVIAIRHWPRRWLRNGQIVVLTQYEPSSSQRRESLPSLLPQVERKEVNSPVQPHSRQFIKRIAGLGGETITIPRHESLQDTPMHTNQIRDETGQVHWVIPEGHIFVRGDNAVASIDSRVWGPIATSQIIAVVLSRPHRHASP